MKPFKQKFFLINGKSQLIYAPSKRWEMNDSPKKVSSCLTLSLDESVFMQLVCDWYEIGIMEMITVLEDEYTFSYDSVNQIKFFTIIKFSVKDLY